MARTGSHDCDGLWDDTCGPGLGGDCAEEDRDACLTFDPEPQPLDPCKPRLPDGSDGWRNQGCDRGERTFDFEASSGEPGPCQERDGSCLP